MTTRQRVYDDSPPDSLLVLFTPFVVIPARLGKERFVASHAFKDFVTVLRLLTHRRPIPNLFFF